MPTNSLPPSAFADLDLPSESIAAMTSKPSSAQNAPVLAPPSSETAPPSTSLSLADSSSSAVGPKPPPNTTAISLYAEHLLHIRTVTLSASLRTARTQQTRAVLSADGSEVSISHEGEVATIRLPVRVRLKPGDDGSAEAALVLPGKPEGKEISLRLSAEDEGGLLGSPGGRTIDAEGNWVPWGAAALNETRQDRKKVRVVCKKCGNPAVREGSVGEWRDLPNENWAEMMEFWHCHRPDHDHGHDHKHSNESDGGKSKGYAAANQLRALSGVGFVDLGALLLKEEDCESIEVSQSPGSRPSKLLCQTCKAQLGEVDDRAEGFRLWKWSLAIAESSAQEVGPEQPRNLDSDIAMKPKLTTYSNQKWVSAHFLSLIENQAVRKFCVKPKHDDEISGEEKIMIWVFTPDLTFSSSISSSGTPPTTLHHPEPTRAMKVLYQLSSPTTSRSQEEQNSFSVEEVRFPPFVYKDLKTALKESGMLMPETARMFKTWQVGLLERFQSGDKT
ncbi:uncharacterized protein BDZ99DRAFT_465502 [Mytilinidion resinicola]|uniref:Ubiquitin-conjugating enzyme E2-binding protein n=1 Tax=Mytilinidion resinicola TaxID=574789 RepID=A0A6A6YFP3_9PEZI|nr:uncharacterized protein BDZ99DRAFT_465502 [Mytilinidion resinicola]KAF2806707.1 hypothetical protein BDZ99DRAFT_465502 [Mytilinidion resinicola]